MGKYRELGTGLDRVFRNNLNGNFDDIGVDVDDLQTQINTLVVSGDSSVEAAQARVEADGTANATLKARLDKKEAEFESQLAQMATNVKSFGVKGDGITNDTLALQSIVDSGYKKIFLPPGTYMVKEWILTPNVHIFGLKGQTIIKRIPNTYTTEERESVIAVRGTSENKAENIIIENIIVDGNESNIVFAEGISGIDMECINLEHVSNSVVRDCEVINSVSEGIDLDYGINNLILNNKVYGCWGYGIHISTGSEGNKVIGNEVENCGFVRSRGGIDQYNGNESLGLMTAKNNVYVGNISKNNRMNFVIRGNGAVFTGNKSSGGVEYDDFTGATNGVGLASERILVTRDLSVLGTQTVTLATKAIPSSLHVLSIIQSQAYKSEGFWSKNGGSRSIYFDATSKLYQNAAAAIIMSKDNAVNRTSGSILAVREGEIDIDWTVTGTGVTGTTTMIFLINF
jgi:parallel beta-helix repeat protein